MKAELNTWPRSLSLKPRLSSSGTHIKSDLSLCVYVLRFWFLFLTTEWPAFPSLSLCASDPCLINPVWKVKVKKVESQWFLITVPYTHKHTHAHAHTRLCSTTASVGLGSSFSASFRGAPEFFSTFNSPLFSSLQFPWTAAALLPLFVPIFKYYVFTGFSHSDSILVVQFTSFSLQKNNLISGKFKCGTNGWIKVWRVETFESGWEGSWEEISQTWTQFYALGF